MMNTTLNDCVTVKSQLLKELCIAALQSRHVDDTVLYHVSESLIQTSLRGVDSHGIELLPHYLRALDAGRINPNPHYKFTAVSPAAAKLDADHAFGHASGAYAMSKAIEMANENGIAAVSVFNSTHFGAAAYFSLLASSKDMIGLSFTHGDSLMLSFRGTRAFFGTNPICFTAPCKEEPFCLDMATSLSNWNKVLRYRSNNVKIPSNWACDEHGNPTIHPELAAALFPIGDYKGFGLSMMIDILCGVLSGMPTGRDISSMHRDPINKKRFLGHFFMAINIESFADVDVFKEQLQQLMDKVRQEPTMDLERPVMVPGDPEKKTYLERIEHGIPVSMARYKEFQAIANEIGVVAI